MNGLCVQVLLHPGRSTLEQSRVAAPEPVYRLLGVADNEQAAPAFAAGRHLFQQRQYQLPLRRVGVLKFIDQEVVDALVEFELHPVRLFPVAEQQVGVPLQVCEIQQAPLALDALVVIQHALAGTVPCRVGAQCLLPPLLFRDSFDFFAEPGVQFQKPLLALFPHGLALRIPRRALAALASGGEKRRLKQLNNAVCIRAG